MTRILIVSGGGDFTDPWHPFAETSGLIRQILDAPGRLIDVSMNVGNSLAGLADADARPDLVVVNAGNAERPHPSDTASMDGLQSYLGAGLPLLIMHVAATAFPQEERWESILGGRWVRGTTMHPDWDHELIHVETDAHPIVAGVTDFSIWDERYSYLRTAADVRGLAWHEHDGLRHPILWARQHGAASVVYDALGHERQSYESPEHQQILRNSANWLLEFA
jgi:type 1 glutamine amidotransferase